MSTTVDKSAILIRPYTKDDHDQVSSILIQGLRENESPTFSSKAYNPKTYLSIIGKATVYTILAELALTAYSNRDSSSSTLEDFQNISETMMKEESAQDLIRQFLKPSLIIIWVIASIFTGLSTMMGLFRSSMESSSKFIESSLRDDLGDIPGYYQSQGTKQQPQLNRSQFWVACLKNYPDIIMGCIALDDLSAHTEQMKKKHILRGGDVEVFEPSSKADGELRRLGVHSSYRRMGIATVMVEKLLKVAKDKGFERLFVSANVFQEPAIKFLTQIGFEKDKIVQHNEFISLWTGAIDIYANSQDTREERKII